MAELIIRQATLNDFNAIYQFVCELEELTFDRTQMQRCYEICLGNPNNIYLIAEIDNKPVGYLSCHGHVLMHHCGLVYEIEELYVDSAYRDHKVGAKLLEAIRERIKNTGYKILEVASNNRRVDAHRFYLNNGFEQTSVKFVQEDARGPVQ